MGYGSSQRVWIPHPYVAVFDGARKARRLIDIKRFGEQKKYFSGDGYDAWHSLRYVAAESVKHLRDPGPTNLAARIRYFDWQRPDVGDSVRWLFEVLKGILWTKPPIYVSFQAQWVVTPRWFWRGRGIELIFMTVGEQMKLTPSSRWGPEFLYDRYDIGGDC